MSLPCGPIRLLRTVAGTVLLLYYSCLTLSAQGNVDGKPPVRARSVHQQQSEHPPRLQQPGQQHGQHRRGSTGKAESETRPRRREKVTEGDRVLTHRIFGYHPWWVTDVALESYRYELLSHVAYFACEVDAATGEPSNTHDWLGTAMVDSMRRHGVRVLLAATCFGAADTRTLLNSAAARDTLIERLITLMRARSADGLNIDFEAVPADAGDGLTRFFTDLRDRLDLIQPGALITAATPAVDWSGAWDFPQLAAIVDLFFIMGYDYSWSGSSRAGPVAPIASGSINVTATVDWYLGQGVPADRLVLGVPYYGYDWPVAGSEAQSETGGRGTARLYTEVQDMLRLQADRQWSVQHRNPWFSYPSPGWRQVWYDDDESLALKYDLVLQRGLAGAGIWALGYDRGHVELWELLREKFTKPTSTASTPAATQLHLDVWPHPVDGRAGRIQLRFTAPAGVPVQLRLHDLLGRTVAEDASLRGTGAAISCSLPCGQLPAGSYLLSLLSGTETRTKPLLLY